MKLFTLFAFSLFASSSYGGVFLPENGSYDFTQKQVAESISKLNGNFLSLQEQAIDHNVRYKLDPRRNEYQIKDWYLQDWYQLQDWFAFDSETYMHSMKAPTFNEAKRKQFSAFDFDKKEFFHYKAAPAMKEWGGLTHPPVKKLSMPLEKYHAGFEKKDYSKIRSPYFSPKLQQEIDDVSRSELSFNNKVLPYADHSAFLVKKKMIAGARNSILFSSLAFVCDESTQEIVDLLIEKSNQGVDVRIMTDGLLAKLGMRDCLKQMIKAGIEVVETKDFFKYEGKSIYHTKTLVVDLEEAMAGGQNMINADNLSRGTDFSNRDIDLHIKGPMVTDIIKQFVENWRHQTTLIKNLKPLKQYENYVAQKLVSEREQGLRGQEHYETILENPATRMNGVCRFVKQAPYEDRHTIGKAYLKLLNHVKQSLLITDAVKSDTYVSKPSDAPIFERKDSFEMANLLYLKVHELADKKIPIDYITTNITMAGNESVAIMHEKIRQSLKEGKDLLANAYVANIQSKNNFYGRPHYKNLMKDWMPLETVNIWTNISFLHSKIFYFDRVVASIGSYNFHHNSTDHAYESTSICMDEDLNNKLDRLMVQDMANSIPLIFSKLR